MLGNFMSSEKKKNQSRSASKRPIILNFGDCFFFFPLAIDGWRQVCANLTH